MPQQIANDVLVPSRTRSCYILQKLSATQHCLHWLRANQGHEQHDSHSLRVQCHRSHPATNEMTTGVIGQMKMYYLTQLEKRHIDQEITSLTRN